MIFSAIIGGTGGAAPTVRAGMDRKPRVRDPPPRPNGSVAEFQAHPVWVGDSPLDDQLVVIAQGLQLVAVQLRTGRLKPPPPPPGSDPIAGRVRPGISNSGLIAG